MQQYHSHYKKTLLGLAVLLLLAGAFSFSKLKTGLFPDITFPKLKVIADAGWAKITIDPVTGAGKVNVDGAVVTFESTELKGIGKEFKMLAISLEPSSNGDVTWKATAKNLPGAASAFTFIGEGSINVFSMYKTNSGLLGRATRGLCSSMVYVCD